MLLILSGKFSKNKSSSSSLSFEKFASVDLKFNPRCKSISFASSSNSCEKSNVSLRLVPDLPTNFSISDSITGFPSLSK